MQRSYHRAFSQLLNRDMEYLLFGHAGAPVIVFPTSQGRFFDFEDRGMVAALGEHIERGGIQLVCVDSVDAESWYAGGAHPRDRIRRHVQYDRYIREELAPAVRQQNDNPFWMTTGCSFGGYHAANFALRHPDLIRRTIAMSGIYDVRQFMDGYYDDEFYHNNPVDYTANLRDTEQIRLLQQQDIIVVTGRDDPNVASAYQLSANLWRAGIGNALRVWDGWAHDWPYWHKMIRLYIGGHD